MNCEVLITSSGQVDVTRYPNIFEELKLRFDGDINEALTYYGVLLTPEFQSLNPSEPSIEDLMYFVSQKNIDNSGELTSDDRNDLLKLSLFSPDIEDFKSSFLSTFEVDSDFGIDADKIRQSGLFPNLSMSEILSNAEMFRDLWYKLHNSDYHVPQMSYDFVEGNLDNVKNPDITLTSIVQDYYDLSSEGDIMERASVSEDSKVLEVDGGSNKVLEMTSSYKSFPTYEYVNGELVRRGLSVRGYLVTLLQGNKDYSNILSEVERASDMIESGEYNSLSEVLGSLKEYTSELGIYFDRDVNDMSPEDVLETLDSMYNLLSDIDMGQDFTDSLDTFVKVYDINFPRVLDKYKSFQVKMSDRFYELGDIHIENSEFIQEELYNKYGLVQVAENTFRKVGKTSLYEMYTGILNEPDLLPQGVLTVELDPINTDILVQDLDKYVSTKASEMLTSNSSDISTLKEIAAHKIIESSNIEYDNTGYSVYEDPEFESDFGRLIQEDERLSDIFYISNNGIESKIYIGEYTKEFLQNILDFGTWMDLQNYAKISGNTSLKGLVSDELTVIDKNHLRSYFSNNLSKLPNYTGSYNFDQGFYEIVSGQDFLRIGDMLLERVGDNLYGEVVDGNAPEIYSESEKVASISDSEIVVEKPGRIVDGTIEFC